MGKVAIFDFNGTLVDDTKEWWICVTNIFREAGITETEIPDIGQFIEAMDTCGGVIAAYHFFGVKWEHAQISAAYIRAYAGIAGNINLYPSACRTLGILQARGIVCALVTMNWNTLLFPALETLRLRDYFRHIAAEVHDKTAAITNICAAENAAPDNCYYVGDMPSDITCAKQAGVKTIALLTELVPGHLMTAKNPDYKIRDLGELPKIIIG